MRFYFLCMKLAKEIESHYQICRESAGTAAPGLAFGVGAAILASALSRKWGLRSLAPCLSNHANPDDLKSALIELAAPATGGRPEPAGTGKGRESAGRAAFPLAISWTERKECRPPCGTALVRQPPGRLSGPSCSASPAPRPPSPRSLPPGASAGRAPPSSGSWRGWRPLSRACSRSRPGSRSTP